MYKEPQDCGRTYTRRLKMFLRKNTKKKLLLNQKREERGEKREEKIEVEKKIEEEENKEEKVEEGKDEDEGTNGQQDQSVQDTQLPPTNPPHSTITPTEIIKIKDVVHTSSQNINQLTVEDLTKILDQTTLQAQLCTSPILVSVEELQKSIDKLKEGEVAPQEPP